MSTPKTELIQFRVDPDIKARLEQLCRHRREKMSVIIRQAVMEYIDRQSSITLGQMIAGAPYPSESIPPARLNEAADKLTDAARSAALAAAVDSPSPPPKPLAGEYPAPGSPSPAASPPAPDSESAPSPAAEPAKDAPQ